MLLWVKSKIDGRVKYVAMAAKFTYLRPLDLIWNFQTHKKQ